MARILIVEDSAIDQHLIRRRVDERNPDLEFSYACSVAVARELLSVLTFDVVVTDYYLDDGTGLEVIEMTQGVPVIVLTGVDDEEIALSTKEAGACNFITKDVNQMYLSFLPTAIRLALSASAALSESLALSTELKELEEKEVQMLEQLRESQKMEAIGLLASGVAHDLNNILAAILGFSELEVLNESSKPQARKNVRQIHRAALRGKALVEQILNFGRKDNAIKQNIDMREVVTDALTILNASISSYVEVQTDFSEFSCVVKGHSSRLHQVVMNICTNAAQAMRTVEKGALLRVSVSPMELREGENPILEQIAPGDYIQIAISDNGPGMSQEVQERIFEPFFTTKEKGEGTGLGLSLVFGIVSEHGGALSVKSELGKGTRIDIYFPQIEGDQLSKSAARPALKNGSGTVLFVDDEEPLTKLAEMMLQKIGYQVVTSTSSSEALELFCKEPSEFDLVVTDQSMPKMQGTELAEKLHELRPDIPIVVCSGFSETVTPENAQSHGFHSYLKKPYSMGELSEAVNAALAEQEE